MARFFVGISLSTLNNRNIVMMGINKLPRWFFRVSLALLNTFKYGRSSGIFLILRQNGGNSE